MNAGKDDYVCKCQDLDSSELNKHSSWVQEKGHFTMSKYKNRCPVVHNFADLWCIICIKQPRKHKDALAVSIFFAL